MGRAGAAGFSAFSLFVWLCVFVWMVAASSYFEDVETRGKCTRLVPRILRKPIPLSPQNRKARACGCLMLGGCFQQEHSFSPLRRHIPLSPQNRKTKPVVALCLVDPALDSRAPEGA